MLKQSTQNNKDQKRSRSFEKVLPYLLIVLGLVGLLASFTLTYDKIQVLKNPQYIPGCNINPILSCGSVMKTEQASLLGVPNTIFGIVAFSALVTIGVVLVSGSKVNKKLWLAIQAGAAAGFLFMHYLFFQGVFRIHAICPWCFVVWMITTPIFWYITLYTLQLYQQRLSSTAQKLSAFMQRHHGNILGLWYVMIFGILLHQFWYYWSTLI